MQTTLVRLQAELNLLKRVLTLGGLLLLLSGSVSAQQFTWPVYEPFGEYPVEPLNLGAGATSNYWNFGNGSSVSSYRLTNAAAMAFPALVADANAVPKGVQSFPVLTSSADRGANFTGQSGDVYVSFLFNYQGNVSTIYDRLFFNLVYGAPTTNYNGGSFTQYRTTIWLTPDGRLKINKNYSSSGTFSATSPVLTTNVPHLIVLRYARVAGSNADRVDLWIDPMPFGSNTDIPPPTLSTSVGNNLTTINGVMLMNRAIPAYTTYNFYFDELRINNTWAGVTPLTTAAPGAMFAVTGGGTTCPDSPPNVGLSGSVAGNDYWLYTNNVYSTAVVGTGAALDFGPQTVPAVYSVLASNTATADIGWMSNSVTVAITQPPVIVAEPVAQSVSTNNRAEFKVTCTGDALGFQWYRDGTGLVNDAHITGANGTNLVIWPATAADIGNYYCIITNTCGASATTLTNGLALQASDELVWAGDGFNICIWDVFAANAEWTGGTGFFHPGDNVTFDDACIYANAVSLNGVLTPSKITVNATREYRWAGAGSLAGTTALVKAGTGTLIIDNNPLNTHLNTYTGGTVISNGTVHITNSWYGLGSGPVTLAGGTLANWQKGNAGGPGVEQGLSNNVSVVANSTWQLDRTGDQAAALLGSLNGNAGTTLSFYHSTTNQNQVHRVRLGGVFTNGLTLACSVNPQATNTALDIGTYNATGAQVYNGPITGPNTGFMTVGTGEVYLNAANTYTRDTTVIVGFLAGSGSINGQLVVNAGTAIGGGSQAGIGTFTVNSNVVLNGNVRIRVNKSLAQSNDVVSATGFITNGGVGTVTITNIGGPALAAGDTFKIFSGAVSNGGALTVTGGGVAWQNNLAIDGSVVVVPSIAGYATNISYTVSGSTLDITWPGTHLGWILQSQTNALGIGLATNWYDVSGTAGVTNQSVPLDPANPTVFYRLRHP